VNTLATTQTEKLKKYLKETLDRDFSEAEINEIKESLYYFAKAKKAYLQQKEEGRR